MTSLALALAFHAFPPPAGDAYRLPPIPVIRDACNFNLAYRAHLEWRLSWGEGDRAAELRAALEETAALREVWDAAWGAHPDYRNSDESKAEYLRRLRLLLGPDAYRRAELPPCVPAWRFNELR